ncbi:MAG TPA: response regulator transcription factor [Terriglobales bacterium]|nr:response regulator transcription factor [Terriglobales bacterium]
MERILIVDDDIDLYQLVTQFLEPEGFQVEAAHDGPHGLERALSGDYSLIVLDIMLPDMGGLEVLRNLRQKSNVPVLILTARGEDVDRIVGLEIGADDYLPKPFNPRELLARIRAILRRSHETATRDAADKLTVGDVELDPGTRMVRRAGEKIELTAVEFNLLEQLLRSAGRVVEREDLAQEVLGRKLSAFDRSLDVHVSNLRKKLGERRDGEDRIKTIRGVGYIYPLAQEAAN